MSLHFRSTLLSRSFSIKSEIKSSRNHDGGVCLGFQPRDQSINNTHPEDAVVCSVAPIHCLDLLLKVERVLSVSIMLINPAGTIVVDLHNFRLWNPNVFDNGIRIRWCGIPLSPSSSLNAMNKSIADNSLFGSQPYVNSLLVYWQCIFHVHRGKLPLVGIAVLPSYHSIP
jgi:hypothetical protein